jgi:glycosyltransferase involved in cell wall biosynthesis
MYHANLVGGVLARLANVRRVFWGIHHANLSPRLNKRSTLMVAGACASLSRVVPTTSIFCSQSSAELHWRLGFSRQRSIVIPNGFDAGLFHPSPEACLSVRTELGVDEETVLIGLFARFDKLKDHVNFCQAAALMGANSKVHFVLAGAGITLDNLTLLSWLEEAGVASRTHLLGLRQDMPRLCSALDILTLCSAGEAFPNVIGEAMACGVPCVVTDVGDCARIVGGTGIVVPARDPGALAEAWTRLLGHGATQRPILGKLARQRILDNFSLERVAAKYLNLYLGSEAHTPR